MKQKTWNKSKEVNDLYNKNLSSPCEAQTLSSDCRSKHHGAYRSTPSQCEPSTSRDTHSGKYFHLISLSGAVQLRYLSITWRLS